jgi:hypothetical protein
MLNQKDLVMHEVMTGKKKKKQYVLSQSKKTTKANITHEKQTKTEERQFIMKTQAVAWGCINDA